MSDDTRIKTSWFVLSITDRTSCQKAIRNGGIAALVSAGLSAIFVGIGFFVKTEDEVLSYFLDPWAIVDVVLVVILAIFILRKSRTAATIMVAYFVYSKFSIWVDLGISQIQPLSIFFLIFYVTAMLGTFKWHKKYKDAPPEPVETESK